MTRERLIGIKPGGAVRREHPVARSCASDGDKAFVVTGSIDEKRSEDERTVRVAYALSAIAAVLAFVAASSGLLEPSLYADTVPTELLPGTRSQDAITLLVALALAALLPRIGRGSLRDRSLWAGLVGYLFYAYAIYAFANVYTPLYVVYLGVLACSLFALLLFFTTLDLEGVRLPPNANADRAGPPRRLVAAVFIALIALFVTLWLAQIVPGVRTRTPPPGATIFVLDFAIVFPLLGIAVWSLLRRRPFGDVLAVVLLIKAGTLGVSVLLGTLTAPLYGLPIVAAEVATYAFMGLVPLALLSWFLVRWEGG